MRKVFTILVLCLTVLLTGCVTHSTLSKRQYGYKPDFTRTYNDVSSYRPSHYRNFVRENSVYLNDKSRQTQVSLGETYSANTYVDAHVETGKPVYHTTFTTSFNENGEVTTTYTSDYAGSKKEKQYWKNVKRQQREIYKLSRKRN